MKLILVSFPYTVGAATMQNPIINQGNSNFQDNVSGLGDTINSFAPSVSFIFSAIFTIMFLFGVVRMGYAIITKTGHVMKFSTGILIWIPITFFIIKIFIILLFTTNGTNGTLLASDIIKLIKTTTYFTSVGMILVGFILFFIYRLIHHPEFGRWSKRLWAISIVLSAASTIIPFILGTA